MGKGTITQRSFVLGELREGFLEADDLEARGQSVRGGLNMRVEATRGLAERYGLSAIMEGGDAIDMIELRPASGLRFCLVIGRQTLRVFAEDRTIAFSITPGAQPWPSTAGPGDIWLEPFREKTVIGGAWGLHQLVYASGAWSFTAFAFGSAAGGEAAQPYWSFRQDIAIQPSAVTGSITITASASLWTSAYVGQRIRYNKREILITGFTSATVLSGTVITELAPSYRLTMDSIKGFRVGDAIIGQDTDYQGVIVAIGATYLDVTTLEFFDGPDVNEKVSCPTSSAKVTAKTVVSPLYSAVWDEPLMSPLRGYPRAGASAAGRLTLIDFPLVPDLVVMSSLRSIDDFAVGASDDDAIQRQCGDNAPRFLHAINAGDLVLLSDAGLYYVSIRDGGLLTPATFNAVLFDKRAASPVRPVLVDDGIVFVEASGQSLAAALLDGNIYLKWSVKPISLYHSHLIKTPVKLCGPSAFSVEPEKYLFVINGDGSMAVMSWFERFSTETIGFLPWQTTGEFRAVSAIFGGYWVLADRVLKDSLGETEVVAMLEEMSIDARLDCEVPVSGAVRFRNMTVSACAGDYFMGNFQVSATGEITGSDAFPDGTVVGLPFTARCQPWPAEHINTPRAGMLKARLIRGAVSVQHTGPFKIRANAITREVGGYAFGDDLLSPPPLRTKLHRFIVTGDRDHPEIEIIRDTPSRLRIMAITQEVQT